MKKKFIYISVLICLLMITVPLYWRHGHFGFGLKKKKFFQTLASHGAYVEFFQSALSDEKVFNNFKRDPIYNLLGEYETYEEGKKYLQLIKEQTPELLEENLFKKLKENDLLGNPRLQTFDSLMISPTTLHYIKVASDLKKSFGSLNGMKIIEIGGGYGGQCKILSDLFEFSNYTIVDLSPSLDFTKKYLELNKVKNVNFLHPDQLQSVEEYDLIISNYDFTQSAASLQKIYMDKIFSHSKRGYVTCNFFPKHYKVRQLSKESLIKKLEQMQLPIEIAPETPPSGKENFLLIWSFF